MKTTYSTFALTSTRIFNRNHFFIMARPNAELLQLKCEHEAFDIQQYSLTDYRNIMKAMLYSLRSKRTKVTFNITELESEASYTSQIKSMQYESLIK